MACKQLLLAATIIGLLAAAGCATAKETPPPAPPAPAEAPLPTATPAPEKPQPTVTPQPAPPPTLAEDENNFPLIPGLFGPKPRFADCVGQLVLTATPADLDKIDDIVTLGNLNPQAGHVFPTDHIYFYPTRKEGAAGPDAVNVYSPANLTVTRIWASEHVRGGFADYNIFLKPCRGITLEFFHIATPNPKLFGDTSAFDDWHLDSEYETGGEIYRIWSKDVEIEVGAGDLLGTAGGNPGQWAFDLGIYDERHRQEPVAAPERWEDYSYLTAVCPLALYEPGPLRDRMAAMVNREETPGEELPCGSVLQDVPGTAQGCWFLEGTTETYPEDPHLALVHSNLRPSRAAFSVGNSVVNLPSRVYEFTPESSGRLNRDFKDITPDGLTYGFKTPDYGGIIIVTMPNATTLYIEALPGATADEATWIFSGDKTTFER